MKIQGAFTVRWAPSDGKAGTGVTILKQQVMYAASTSGTAEPATTSTDWKTTVAATGVGSGQYLWTWTQITYSDGNVTNAYSVARQGIDGKGIQSSVVTYSEQPSNVDPTTITDRSVSNPNGWGTFPASLTDGYWLYTRTHIIYSDNNSTDSYSVAQVGVGSYFAGTQEYYKAGTSPTEPPAGNINSGTYTASDLPTTTWSTTRPWTSSTPLSEISAAPYLWNFEMSADSRGNKYVTEPRCLGNFAKGISSIIETYAISAKGVIPSGRSYPEDIAESDWADEQNAAAPTETKRYQWNKTVTTYNDNSTQTSYHVSAVKGIDGKGSIYIDMDNENDSMLYDGQGNLVSNSPVSAIRLYDNGSDVTSAYLNAGGTFTLDNTGCSAVVSINTDSSTGVKSATLTVQSMTSTAKGAYVIVTAIYGSVSYYARMTVKKLVGIDKYELVCTPSALTYNSDVDASGYSVKLEVYRTAQNGTRALLQNLPSGYQLTAKGNAVSTALTLASSYSGGSVTFTADRATNTSYRIELLDASSQLLDYDTIPIAHVENGGQGDPGDPGTDASNYYLIPSVEEIRREKSGQLSASSVTCKVMSKQGTATPAVSTDATLYYKQTELGVVIGDTDNGGKGKLYTGAVTVSQFTSAIQFTAYIGTAIAAQRQIPVNDVDITQGSNLINGTNFTDARDATTICDAAHIISGGPAGHSLYHDPFLSAAADYQEVFRSDVHKTSDARLLPYTWYTLSFYAKADGSIVIGENLTAAAYGFAQQKAYFTKGTHHINCTGLISQAAVTAGKTLRIYVYKANWSWSDCFETSSTTQTTFGKDIQIPASDYYLITAFVYKDGEGTISDTSLTATVVNYELFNRNIMSYVYGSGNNGCIDTGYVQVADGIANPAGNNGDGDCIHELTTDWVRHTFTFRTRANIPSDETEMVLLRHLCGTAKVYVSGIKLEVGIQATDWCRSEYDKTGATGLEGCINRITEWKAATEYHNDSDLTSGASGFKYIDTVSVGAGTSSQQFYRCRVTHTSASGSYSASNPLGCPSATNDHWEMLDNMTPIYTPFILATDGVIRFMQGNQLLITDADGNVVAGMKGGGSDDINIFAGDYVPKDAPFRVNYKGEMWATNAHIEGEITSEKGSIGGFAISKQQLLASYQASDSSDVESMLLTYNLIRFTNNDVRVFIGDGESGISGGNVSSPIVVTNSRSTTDGLYCNNGFEADVYGCNASDDNSYTGNHAFIASRGDFCGFRKRTRRISANAYLDSFDSNIIVTSRNDVYITLSDGTYMEDGQEYFIMPATTLTYNKICVVENTTNPGSGTQHWFTNNASTTPLKAIKCLYDKVNNKWHIFQIA